VVVYRDIVVDVTGTGCVTPLTGGGVVIDVVGVVGGVGVVVDSVGIAVGVYGVGVAVVVGVGGVGVVGYVINCYADIYVGCVVCW